MTACGSSSSKTAANPPAASGSTGSAGATGSTGATGSATNGATVSGTPVKVGLVNQEGAATGDFTQVTVETLAAEKYINQELGGISGHPLQVDSCITDGTPEKSQSCANKLIGDKVVSVMTGVDLGAPAALPLYSGASIPLTFGAPAQPAEFNSKDAFYALGGTPTQVPAVAEFAKERLHAKKVVSIGTDAPAAVSAYNTFIAAPLQKLGIQSSYTKAAAGAADFAPQVQQAVSQKPDAIVLLVGPQDCIKVIKALQGAGNSAPAIGTGSCIVPELFTQGASAAKGFYFTGETQQLQQSPSTDELQKFLHVNQVYAKQPLSKVDAYSLLGFQSTMDFFDLANKIGASKVTSSTIRDFMKATKDQHNWLSTPYTCAGPPIAAFPSICHPDATMYQFNGKALVDVGSFNGIKLLG